MDSGVARTIPDLAVPDTIEAAALAASDASTDVSNNQTDASLSAGLFPFRSPFVARRHDADEDGICGSTYGTTANGMDWQQQFQYVITKYKKPVMSCEYTNVAPDAPGGALINGVMQGFANGMGYGSFIWEPRRYPSLNGAGALFTKTGHVHQQCSDGRLPEARQVVRVTVPASICH
ncbi:MAG: hypothetical protein M3O50_10595 [Myxococcota bacterium]|nr:hypothetical protein [Myxococcota bacterium]